MTDRLALWDRLMVLASKAHKAVDASSKISYGEKLDESLESSAELQKQVDRANNAKSTLLQLLLADCLTTDSKIREFSDETSISDRFKTLKEGNESKMAVDLLNGLPLGQLFAKLQESEGDDEETRTRVEEARRAGFLVLLSLVKAGVTPSDEPLGNFGQQKLDEEAMMNGLNTLKWLKRQRSLKQRGKKRKQEVDTKASKGRKIRYVEIPKLVNFFPATPETIPWTHGKRDELFKSLFA
uniref:Apoptosis-antagonizing transcription factor C-terminal domain-containing protein n=1 Tax=Globodera rostochiensis TaxID=31243 RepID=A0A914HVQ5_GLORO